MGTGASVARQGHPALVEAEIRKLDADAERSAAEAVAVRERSAVEAERSAVEAASLFRRDLVLLSPLAIGALVTAALAVDWYLHESPAHLRRRVAAAFRKGPPNSSLSLPESLLLPVPGDKLRLGTLPTMVLGPSGCGKSTALAKLAAEAFRTRPTLFIGLREPSSRKNTESGAAGTRARFEDVAQQFYSQVNYPGRRALVDRLLPNGVKVKTGTAEASLSLPTQERLVDALKTVFSVGESLYTERSQAGMAHMVAPPAVVFHEVQDLIKDERLASSGGRYVFDTLAVLLVRYGVDRKVVRTAVAGSSAMLSVEFEKTVAHGARWIHHLVPDPEETVMAAALQRCGYTPSEATDMVQLCGSRLRLLNEPLAEGASNLSASTFCSKMCTSAEGLVLWCPRCCICA